jgi:hypothetical protein
MTIEQAIILFLPIITILLFLLFVLSFKFLKLRKKVKTLSVAYSKIEALVSSTKSSESDNDIHKENFIKFLSDSRDWAYEYIETVQSGLNKFVSEVDPDISYFDEYGEVLSIGRPDFDAMKNISKSYKELKKLLPDEGK